MTFIPSFILNHICYVHDTSDLTINPPNHILCKINTFTNVTCEKSVRSRRQENATVYTICFHSDAVCYANLNFIRIETHMLVNAKYVSITNNNNNKSENSRKCTTILIILVIILSHIINVFKEYFNDRVTILEQCRTYKK